MNPFAFLAPYKLIIEIGSLFLILASIAVGIHKFLDYEQNIGYQKRVTEDNIQAAKDLAAAHDKEQRDAKQLKDAQDANILANQRIDQLASALATSSSGLRGASDSAIRNLSGASAETARATAITFAGIFGDCQARYGALAERADRHVADIRLLQAAP